MSSRTGAIACRSLAKEFDGQRVVDDVTFDVTPGTITGFVGANGAGKTTTMRMLLGLVAPSSGTALINGLRYRELTDPRRQVGAVVDEPGAHPGHSARTHLTIMAMAAGLPRRRVEEVLELVELAEHASRRVGGYLMGMLRRLALAGALLGDPGVLILDEPVNGLDPPGILWVRDLLRRLAGEGRALLVSSRLLAELAEVADRVVIIDRGHLIADMSLGDLPAGRSRRVELRCADPGRMVRAVTAHDHPVELDGDLLILHGITARQAGEIAATACVGAVYWLTERANSFGDVYFALAGSMAGPPATAADGRLAS